MKETDNFTVLCSPLHSPDQQNALPRWATPLMIHLGKVAGCSSGEARFIGRSLSRLLGVSRAALGLGGFRRSLQLAGRCKFMPVFLCASTPLWFNFGFDLTHA